MGMISGNNYDNSFLNPSLTPPQQPDNSTGPGLDNLKEKKAFQQKDGQGNVVREGGGKERVHSDGSQTYSTDIDSGTQHDTTVHDHDQSDDGQQGSGGQGSGSDKDGSGGGSGGSSGGQSDGRGGDGTFSFQEILEKLAAEGDSPAVRDAASVDLKAAALLSTDELVQVDANVQYSDKYNIGNNSLSAKDLSTLSPGAPRLVQGREIPNPKEVLKEIAGNPWLQNEFMTALTENLLAVVRIKMEQEVIEGKVSVELLVVIGDLGKALGDLALKKAELEAEMHMWQATAAFMTFGVTVAAGALSIGATLGSSLAGGLKDVASVKNASSDAVAGAQPKIGQVSGWAQGKTPTGTGAAAPKPPSSSTSSTTSSTMGAKPPTIGGNRAPVIGSRAQKTTVSQDTTPTTPWQKAGSPTSKANASQTSAEKTTTSSSSEVSSVTSSEKKGGFLDNLKTKFGIKSNTTAESTKTSAETKTTVSAEDKSTASAEGRGGFFSNLKSKLSAKPASGTEAGTTSVGESKAVKRAENIETGAKIAEHLGETLMHGSSSLGNAADNLVQMAYKPLIGEVERDTQIATAQKQIAQQVADSNSQDLKDAASAIDQTLQSLSKQQDEVARAHSISRG